MKNLFNISLAILYLIGGIGLALFLWFVSVFPVNGPSFIDANLFLFVLSCLYIVSLFVGMVVLFSSEKKRSSPIEKIIAYGPGILFIAGVLLYFLLLPIN